jgi:hypothetical protein
MSRTYLAAIASAAALALLASTMPSSVTTAGELKAKQKKQRLLLPAVQKIRDAVVGCTKAKPCTRKGNVTPPGTVKFIDRSTH